MGALTEASDPEVALMREEFKRMRRAAAAGEVDAVFVHSDDRLRRNGSEFLAALEELERSGVAVHVVKHQHGVRARAMVRFRQTSKGLVRFVLSLVGHGNSNTARNRE